MRWREIRDRVDLARVVEGLLGPPASRQGRRLLWHCPFHDDRHPSFQVDPDRNAWKCWPCGLGGDAPALAMKLEGLTFPDAARRVAELGGLPWTDGRSVPLAPRPRGEGRGEGSDGQAAAIASLAPSPRGEGRGEGSDGQAAAIITPHPPLRGTFSPSPGAKGSYAPLAPRPRGEGRGEGSDGQAAAIASLAPRPRGEGRGEGADAQAAANVPPHPPLRGTFSPSPGAKGSYVPLAPRPRGEGRGEGADGRDAAITPHPPLRGTFSPSPGAKDRRPTGLPLLEAMDLVARSVARLHAAEGAEARAYLHGRGLSDATIAAAWLGWCPGAWLPCRDGMRSFRASGIVIPWLDDDGALRLVKLRQPDGKTPKYVEAYRDAPGLYPGPRAGRPGRPAIVVEGEFDALLLAQELGERAGVVTLGPAVRPPDGAALWPLLLARPRFLALDADAAGDRSAASWPATFARIRPPDPFKDWTQVWQADPSALRAFWIAVLGRAVS